MRAALPATAILGLLLTAGPVRAESASASAATASAAVPTTVAPSPAPAIPARLNLGSYRSVYADDPAALAADLHFQEEVEVRGKAMDSRSLTLKLEWWMKDIDLTRGATPSSMSAPSIAEMRDYRPHPGDALNFVPAMEWLAEKLGGKKKD
jgi:hypothetical protein